jgi:3-oxoacyl-[acyl-carrier protein] reductase
LRFKDKITLVTGGATGIGGATAELFGAEGATSLILDYNGEEGQANTNRIIAAGGQAAFYQADISSAASVATACKSIAADYGRLDVVVCSAGVLTGAYRTIEELPEEEWDTTIDTNLKGTYLTCKYTAALMEKAGSSVLLLIASGAGVRGSSSSYAYAASKAGMHGMHYKLQSELGPRGVRLHVVCPGSIATPLKLDNIAQAATLAGEDPEAAREQARQSLGDPMGIAKVLAFLSSEDGSYINGTVFTR